MDKKNLLGKRIKELRTKNGYKQELLAEKIEIEARQLSKLEQGKHYPSFETIEKLLKALNITFEELLEVEHLQEKEVLKAYIANELESFDEKQMQEAYKLFRMFFK